MLEIGSKMIREETTFCPSCGRSHFLMKAKNPILELDFCQVDIVSNLSIGQQGGLEYFGSSKELFSLSQSVAMSFVF